MADPLVNLYEGAHPDFYSIVPDLRPGAPAMLEAKRITGNLHGVFKLTRKEERGDSWERNDLLLHQESGLIAMVLEKVDFEQARLVTLYYHEDVETNGRGLWIGVGWCWPLEQERPPGFPAKLVEQVEGQEAFMDLRHQSQRRRGVPLTDYEPAIGKDVLLKDFSPKQLEEANAIADLMEKGWEGSEEEPFDLSKLNEPLDNSGDVRITHIGPGKSEHKAKRKNDKVFSFDKLSPKDGS